ncbi:MAG: hypothetical protein AAF975_07790, partial [Spirochaetota bacterium]
RFTNQLRQLVSASEERFPCGQSLSCFPSPPEFYRSRIEFALHRREGGRLSYVMFDANKKARYLEVSTVPLRPISERMIPLLRYLEREPLLSKSLFQINWRADLAGQVMLSLLYHRKREDESWSRAAIQLQKSLGLYSVLGRSKSRLLHVGPVVLENRLPPVSTGSPRLYFRQNDTCFSQPNAYTNLDMLGWASRYFYAPSSDLLELYCGIGNFTCALAPGFRKVFATEVVRSAIPLCLQNLALNGLNNVAVKRLSAAETAEALLAVRKFKRLADINLAEYDFTHLLLDPPRSGLDTASRNFAMNFSHILYISCNPQEMLRDLAFWQEQGSAYSLVAGALFDQFPDTEHLEAGLVLRRLPSS